MVLGRGRKAVGYQWMKPYTEVLDLENGTPFAQWYNGGTCNVVESALSRWLADEETRIQPALQYEGKMELQNHLHMKSLTTG